MNSKSLPISKDYFQGPGRQKEKKGTIMPPPYAGTGWSKFIVLDVGSRSAAKQFSPALQRWATNKLRKSPGGTLLKPLPRLSFNSLEVPLAFGCNYRASEEAHSKWQHPPL